MRLLGGHTLEGDALYGVDWPPGFLDLYVAYKRAQFERLRDGLHISEKELRAWINFGNEGFGPEPPIIRRSRTNTLTEEDVQLLDAIDLDEINEVLALEEEVLAKWRRS